MPSYYILKHARDYFDEPGHIGLVPSPDAIAVHCNSFEDAVAEATKWANSQPVDAAMAVVRVEAVVVSARQTRVQFPDADQGDEQGDEQSLEWA